MSPPEVLTSESQNQPSGSQSQPSGSQLSGTIDSQDVFRLILQQNQQMAEQNARLMAMMDRLNTQEAQVRAKQISSPEFIIESLASNIREFCYDPDNGMVFDRWYQKYEDLFLKDGENLDDAAKVRLLLRSLSVSVHDKYVNFLLPKHYREYSFADTVSKLKQLFGMRTTLFSKRYQCFQLSKKSEEDFVTYAATVNKRCEDFELNRITADQFKSLIFICGLRSSKEADIRTRLLSKLESDGECKLDTLINECQWLQNLKHDTALIEQKSSISASVCAVNQKKYQSKPSAQAHQSKDSKNSSIPKTPCWQCGGMHFVRECPFANHTCKSCNKVGHKEGYCSCISVKPNTGGKEFKNKKKSTVNGVFEVNQVNSEVRRKFITVIICGVKIKLQFDTASDISIISKETWKNLGSPELKPSKSEAKTTSGKPLHLIGELACSITLGGVIKDGTCFVTTHPSLNLFGLDWIELFKLWSQPLSAICNQVRSMHSPIQFYKTAFPNVFKETLGHCKKTKVKLNLKQEARSVFKPKRPVPFTSVAKVDAELDRLEQLDIITPVDFSQWAAPIVTVRKPNGKIRICADYSTVLNAALEANNYPLPVPDDIFTKLNGCKFFSIIDLSDAYLQVEVDDDSKELLTINTHRGLYRFNRLAPGVKSAPGAFQQLMNGMIADLQGVESFLDDIIVFSKTEMEHHQRLEALFKRLEEYGFHLREEKCSIFQQEIKYLGHIVDKNGLRPNPAKIEAIVKMPAPTDISSLRSFLGAVNFYGKFVKKMHQLRRPLDALLKKDVQFNWSSICQQSFEKIKEVLQSGLLLTHYDPKLEIIIAADASKSGIGAVAMHRFPDGSLKAIAHASRTLTQAEVGYSQIEKEGLALIFAVTKFHRMILGRKFTLQTDHQPLLRMFGSKKGIPLHTANRLQRWALTLLCYDFEIEYVSTTQFGYADMLSRLINHYTKSDEDFIIAAIQFEKDIEVPLDEAVGILPITFKMVLKNTSKCPVLQKVISFIQQGWPSNKSSIEDEKIRQFFPYREALSVVKGCIMMADRLIIPFNFHRRILKRLHRGHPGIERMKSIARSHVFWPKIDNAIEDFVKQCNSCAAQSKSQRKVPLQSWPLTVHPWERIHMDFAGPFFGQYFLVVVDAHSKWPEVKIVQSPTTSSVTEFLDELFSRFGVPTTVVSGNGSQLPRSYLPCSAKQTESSTSKQHRTIHSPMTRRRDSLTR
ncbi:uncharacterized protein K02A2.6-like [Armigeres subalbatus]|uniref:uncharacterized protein K02A2.6-like n=1 Tax=Armigeres subalbatus TaxID=124917 RepID=UPI002ED1D666